MTRGIDNRDHKEAKHELEVVAVLFSSVVIGSGSPLAGVKVATVSVVTAAGISASSGCAADRREVRQEERTSGRGEHRQESRRDWDT